MLGWSINLQTKARSTKNRERQQKRLLQTGTTTCIVANQFGLVSAIPKHEEQNMLINQDTRARSEVCAGQSNYMLKKYQKLVEVLLIL